MRPIYLYNFYGDVVPFSFRILVFHLPVVEPIDFAHKLRRITKRFQMLKQAEKKNFLKCVN